MNYGFSLYGQPPVYNYIALEDKPAKTGTEIKQDLTNDLQLETNKLLNNNFKTIILILILGFVAMYFLLKKG